MTGIYKSNKGSFAQQTPADPNLNLVVDIGWAKFEEITA